MSKVLTINYKILWYNLIICNTIVCIWTGFTGYYTAVFVDEDDVATYAIKTIDDPRTLNKTIYIRPPENILSQSQLVEIWEKLTGKKLDKFSISKEDFLASMEGNKGEILTSNFTLDSFIGMHSLYGVGKDFTFQVGVGHLYPIYYEGCLTNFEIGEEGEEATTLYSEVNYKPMDEYLKLYVEEVYVYQAYYMVMK